MHCLRMTVLLLLMLSPTALLAQNVEITPFAGFRFGGELDSDDRFYRFDPFEFEIEDGESLGVIVDFRLHKNLFLELTFSQQETELREQSGLFDPVPAERLFDLDVNYYHVGVLYQWTPGQVQPFVSASLGATHFSPASSILDDVTRFSAGFGGGVKLFFTDNIGLRFEGRAYSTLLDDDDEFYCDYGDCYRSDGTWVTQGELRGGLIFAF